MNMEILNEKKKIILEKENQMQEILKKIDELKEIKKDLSNEIKIGNKAVETYEKALLEIEEIK